MRLKKAGLALGILAIASFSLGAAGDEEEKKGGPPFADGPKEEVKPKPATRAWTTNKGGFAFTFSFNPGIPDANGVTEILVIASDIPKTPHPRYGSRVPLDDARIVVEATNPAGELVGRFRAHAIPLSTGKYGFHITPTQDGIYTLALTGKSVDGRPLAAEVKMPVNVWPLPAELQGSGDEGGGNVRAVIRQPVIQKK